MAGWEAEKVPRRGAAGRVKGGDDVRSRVLNQFKGCLERSVEMGTGETYSMGQFLRVH